MSLVCSGDFSLNVSDNTEGELSILKNNIYKVVIKLKTTNEELKKVVKEIRVVSKNEIYVYFNIAEDIEGLNFPINISDVVEIDTDSNNRAQRCT